MQKDAKIVIPQRDKMVKKKCIHAKDVIIKNAITNQIFIVLKNVKK